MLVADAVQRRERRSFRAMGDFHLSPSYLIGPSGPDPSNSGAGQQQPTRSAAGHPHA